MNKSHLYLRVCEIFSYDRRVELIVNQQIEEKQMLREDIRMRKIDLENVDDYRITCRPFSTYVYNRLLLLLLGISSEIKGTRHHWITFSNGKEEVKADPTIKNDFARVKIGLNTKGYELVHENEEEYLKKLKMIDSKIGYIKSDYFGQSDIKSYVDSYIREEDRLSSDDLFIAKLYGIKELLDSYQFSNFEDAQYALYYFCEKSLEEEEFLRVSEIPLYQDNLSDDWDFLNVYPVTLQKDQLYFVLEQDSASCSFYEVSKADAISYVKNLKGGKNKHNI